jgi:glycosyltransferase involved in cell wall biosynthesis
VLEAMAMAKPVIATAWGGPADYLDSTCGILVEPRSRDFLIGGFAYAMRLLMEDPTLCRRMGDAGRAKVVKTFDW